MIKNFFKVALRNLWKNKGFSFINIFGLAVGIAVCLIIMLYVVDELSYDKYNKKANRIYRVDGDIKFGGTHFVLAVAPDAMGPTLKKDYPQVEQYVRFRQRGGLLIRKGNENVHEDDVVFADSTLFDVFTLPVINGDPKRALTEPHSLVITEKAAKKYFNTDDAAGKTLTVNDTSLYKVTAVIKNIPADSHFNFDFFISMAGLDESRQNNWLSNNFNTYILLKESADPKRMDQQLDTIVDKYVGSQAEQFLNTTLEAFRKLGNYDRYSLTPLEKIHLYSDKVGELAPTSNIQYIYIFSAIGIFILLIACVNFMNLSTAHSSNRAKEVGVRKVLGSVKKDLVYQFLTESILLSFIAMLVALVLIIFLLPYFNQLSGKHLEFGLFFTRWMIPSLLLFVLLVGLLAGGYPAFYLSSFQPIAVLKGRLTAGFRNSRLRSILVVFQFFISITLIVGTVVIYRQLNFIRNKNIGFEREHILIVKNAYSLGNQAKSFKNELAAIPGIHGITITGFLPTSDYRNDSPLFPDATLDQKTAVSMQNWYVDEDYIPTLQMQIIKGRNFSANMPTDSSSIIINEAAAKLLNFQDPLNKTLYYITDLKKKTTTTYKIIGVVKDFNFSSLRQSISPMALFIGTDKGSVAIRFKTANITGLISEVENKWKRIVPGQPFSYSFMNEDFDRIYSNEQRIGKIAMTFSILAVLIACLGLFGLVTYAAEQRTKEIGVRKVLGATITNIVSMLSKDLLRLVIIASLIAFPVAWWVMNRWLRDFAYRINIGWWVFAVAALVALFIALATVAIKAFTAAVANPVKSLRTE